MAIKGSLEDISLSDVLQLPNLTKKSGLLIIRNGEKQCNVYFKNGEVVYAKLGEQVDNEAIISLFDWTSGDFEFFIGENSPKETIKMPLQYIILDAVRKLDEKKKYVKPKDIKKNEFFAKELEDKIVSLIKTNTFIEVVMFLDSESNIISQIPDNNKYKKDMELYKELFIQVVKICNMFKKGQLNQMFLQYKKGYLFYNAINSGLTLIMISSAVANLAVFFLAVNKILAVLGDTLKT